MYIAFLNKNLALIVDSSNWIKEKPGGHFYFIIETKKPQSPKQHIE